MAELIRKSHNVTILMYHLVFPAKYRKSVFTEIVDIVLKESCLGISDRYEMIFLEIGTDEDHVHLLIQSVPKYSVTKLVKTIKSITAREIFKKAPEVKKWLWGGEFLTDGYFASTVGQNASDEVIHKYIRNQGGNVKDYKNLYSHDDSKYEQLTLF